MDRTLQADCNSWGTCTIDMPRGPAKFRTTVVKPYLTDQPDQPEEDQPEEEVPEEAQDEQPVVRRGRGRPKGSKNVRRAENQEVRHSKRHFLTNFDDFDEQFITAMGDEDVTMTFMT